MNKRLQINIKVLQKDVNIVSEKLEFCTDAISTFELSGTEFWKLTGLQKQLLMRTR